MTDKETREERIKQGQDAQVIMWLVIIAFLLLLFIGVIDKGIPVP